jgi:hypothetical protein
VYKFDQALRIDEDKDMPDAQDTEIDTTTSQGKKMEAAKKLTRKQSKSETYLELSATSTEIKLDGPSLGMLPFYQVEPSTCSV